MSVLFYLRSGGKYRLLGDAVMDEFFLIIELCDVLIRQWTFFSTEGQMDSILYLVTLSWPCLC